MNWGEAAGATEAKSVTFRIYSKSIQKSSLGGSVWTVLDISSTSGHGGTGGRIHTAKALDRLEAEDAGIVKGSLK